MSDETHGIKKKKLRIDYIPPESIAVLAKVLTDGADKHGAYDWKTQDPEDFFASMYRHLIAYHSGQRIDPDSGLPTSGHIAANAMFLIWHDLKNKILLQKTKKKVGSVLDASTEQHS